MRWTPLLRKQNKNTTHYVLDTTIRKQSHIMLKRHIALAASVWHYYELFQLFFSLQQRRCCSIYFLLLLIQIKDFTMWVTWRVSYKSKNYFTDFVCPVYVLSCIAHKCLYVIWLSNNSILSVPDEGYSRNVSWAVNLISTLLFHSWTSGVASVFFSYISLSCMYKFLIEWNENVHVWVIDGMKWECSCVSYW